MKPRVRFFVAFGVAVLGLLIWLLSGEVEDGSSPEVQSLGDYEITGRLIEIPARFPDPAQFSYAFILKYKIVESRRGTLSPGDVVYVGQYNPPKPRKIAADASVKEVGGSVREFVAGQFHRIAMAKPLKKYFGGPITNEYEDIAEDDIYWGIWTNWVDPKAVAVD